MVVGRIVIVVVSVAVQVQHLHRYTFMVVVRYNCVSQKKQIGQQQEQYRHLSFHFTND